MISHVKVILWSSSLGVTSCQPKSRAIHEPLHAEDPCHFFGRMQTEPRDKCWVRVKQKMKSFPLVHIGSLKWISSGILAQKIGHWFDHTLFGSCWANFWWSCMIMWLFHSSHLKAGAGLATLNGKVWGDKRYLWGDCGVILGWFYGIIWYNNDILLVRLPRNCQLRSCWFKTRPFPKYGP